MKLTLSRLSGDINNSITAEFERAMADFGLTSPGTGIEADGLWHRCNACGHKNDEGNGSYCLKLDGIHPCGWFGNWKTGGQRFWHARTCRKITPEERAEYRAEQRHLREQRYAEAADRANQIWTAAGPAPAGHRYLAYKGVAPVGLRTTDNESLLVPLRDTSGDLCSLQFISETGRERFLKGGRVHGCFHVISSGNASPAGLNARGLNLICEGYATAWRCFEAMGGVPAVVAFDAGNLLAVAKALREGYPKASFIICADDNWKTKDNPGKIKGLAAAKAIGAEIAFPVFSPGHHRKDNETDFNDLHAAEGLGAVRACIEAAEAVEKREEREARPINADLVEKIEAAILSLAALSEVAYETVRKDEAKALKIDVRFLDKKVKEARKASTPAGAGPSAEEAEKPAAISTLEPWPEAVDGQELAGELTAAFKRHVIMTDDEALAAALWCLHSHAIDAATISPILMVKSPERRCGKTTAMKILKWLAAESLMASNLTASSVYRVVDQWHPSLIIDEGDSFLKNSDELRNVLNSGHDREGAYVIRTAQTSKGFEVKTFSTWGAKAMALIGTAPDTLEDRSITIKLRRKLRSEKIVTLRGQAQNIKNLGRKAARWVADHLEELRGHDARVPSQITNDRAADNWRTLLSIADMLGGEWPAKARAAALAIEGVEDEPDAGQTPGLRLLADCRRPCLKAGAWRCYPPPISSLRFAT